MSNPRVGILAAGEMGAGIGAALVEAGISVSTVLAGRSAESVARAQEAGMEDRADVADLVSNCDLFLSIVPPALAIETGRRVAEAMRATGATPDVVECNAISVPTLVEVHRHFADLDCRFVDGGIIGRPPNNGNLPRTFVSGPKSEAMWALDGIGFALFDLGRDLGYASNLKMVYASLSKGTNALIAAALLTAARLDVFDELLNEMKIGLPTLHDRAESYVARLPADSGRWAPEMDEIARTFADTGMPAGFHQGAAEVMRILAESRFGHETRRTIDRSRTLEDTIRAIVSDLHQADTPRSD